MNISKVGTPSAHMPANAKDIMESTRKDVLSNNGKIVEFEFKDEVSLSPAQQRIYCQVKAQMLATLAKKQELESYDNKPCDFNPEKGKILLKPDTYSAVESEITDGKLVSYSDFDYAKHSTVYREDDKQIVSRKDNTNGRLSYGQGAVLDKEPGTDTVKGGNVWYYEYEVRPAKIDWHR